MSGRSDVLSFARPNYATSPFCGVNGLRTRALYLFPKFVPWRRWLTPGSSILSYDPICLVGETRTHIILAPDQATSEPIGLPLVISNNCGDGGIRTHNLRIRPGKRNRTSVSTCVSAKRPTPLDDAELIRSGELFRIQSAALTIIATSPCLII